MIPSRVLLLCLLSVGPMFAEVAEGRATEHLQTDFEDLSLDESLQAEKEFKRTHEIVSQLNKNPVNKKDEKKSDNQDDKKDDKSSGDWIGICHDLSDDLEKSWNLTVVVTERTVAVLWKLGSPLYDIINCKMPLIGLPLTCMFDNLKRIKDILDPAVVEAYGFAKEGISLVPKVIKDTRQCYNF